jgi:hypothetical protein
MVKGWRRDPELLLAFPSRSRSSVAQGSRELPIGEEGGGEEEKGDGCGGRGRKLLEQQP